MKLYNLCKVCNVFGPCGTSGPFLFNEQEFTEGNRCGSCPH